MKKKVWLFISVCSLLVSINLSGCKNEHMAAAPDDGDGDGGGVSTLPSSPPPVSQEVLDLENYFANTAGVNVNQIYYDVNTDTFGQTGTSNAISHAELSKDYYYSVHTNPEQ